MRPAGWRAQPFNMNGSPLSTQRDAANRRSLRTRMFMNGSD